MRSRRQSEKLDKHVRLVPLAPVGSRQTRNPKSPNGDRGRVAQARDRESRYGGYRLSRAVCLRTAVSTRVQFSPVTPFSLGDSQAGRRPILNRIMWRFESSSPSHGRVADRQGAALSMQKMRVQLSPRSPGSCGVAKLLVRIQPPPPWGQTRLVNRGRSFKPLQAGSIPAGPTRMLA